MPAIDSRARTICIVDAHRGDGNRFLARADEKLTAFFELELVIRAAPDKSQELAPSIRPRGHIS